MSQFKNFPTKLKLFKDEADFQSWFSGYITDQYWWIAQHKLSDQSMSKKPCDYFFINEVGQTVWCELKVIPGFTININRFEPQQVEFLTHLTSLYRQWLPRYSLAYAVLYSKKNQEVRYLPWDEIQQQLLETGSLKVFE